MEEHTSASVYIPSSSVLQKLLGKAKAQPTKATSTPSLPAPTTTPLTQPFTRQSSAAKSTQPTRHGTAASATTATACPSPVTQTYAAVLRQSGVLGEAPKDTHKTTMALLTLPSSAVPSSSSTSASPSLPPAAVMVTRKEKASNSKALDKTTATATSTSSSQEKERDTAKEKEREKSGLVETRTCAIRSHRAEVVVPEAAEVQPSSAPKGSPEATQLPSSASVVSAPAAAVPDAETTTTTTTTAKALLADEDVSFIMAAFTWHVDLLMLLLQHAPSPLKVVARGPQRGKAVFDNIATTTSTATTSATPASSATAVEATTSSATVPSITPISSWIDLFQASSAPATVSATTTNARRDKTHATQRGWASPARTGGAGDEVDSPAGRSWLDNAMFPSLDEAQQYWISTRNGGRRRNRTFLAPTPVTPRSPAASTSPPSPLANHDEDEDDAQAPDMVMATTLQDVAEQMRGDDTVLKGPYTATTVNNSNSSMMSTNVVCKPAGSSTRFYHRGSSGAVATNGGTAGNASAALASPTSGATKGSPSLINVSGLITHANTSSSATKKPDTVAASCESHSPSTRSESSAAAAADEAPVALARTHSTSSLVLLPSSSLAMASAERTPANRAATPCQEATRMPSALAATQSNAVPSHYHKSKRRAGRGRRCAKRVLRRYNANFLPIGARGHFVYGPSADAAEEDEDDDDNEDQGATTTTMPSDDASSPSCGTATAEAEAAGARVNAWTKGEAGQHLFPRGGAAVVAARPICRDTPEENRASTTPTQDDDVVKNRETHLRRTSSLDVFAPSLMRTDPPSSWFYSSPYRGLNRHAYHSTDSLTASPSAPRHDRAHVLAQLLTSNISLHSMYSSEADDTEEEDENRAQEEAFAMAESEEEKAWSSFSVSTRQRYGSVGVGRRRAGSARSDTQKQASSAALADLGSPHMMPLLRPAHSLRHHASPRHADAQAGSGGTESSAGRPTDDVSTDTTPQRDGFPLEKLGRDAARALLHGTALSDPHITASSGSSPLHDARNLARPSHRQIVSPRENGGGERHGSTHHGRRHKRFFYSAQPMLDKQKERRKTERLRKRREERLARGSGSDVSLSASTSSSSSLSSRSLSVSSSDHSISGGDLTDASSSGTSFIIAAANLHNGSLGSLTDQPRGSSGGETEAASHMRQNDQNSKRRRRGLRASSPSTAGGASSRTPYSRTTSGYTPTSLSHSDASIVLPSPRQTLPPAERAPSSSTAASPPRAGRDELPLPSSTTATTITAAPSVTRTSTTAPHAATQSDRAQRYTVTLRGTAAAVASSSSSSARTPSHRGPQVKLLATIKPSSRRVVPAVGRASITATTKTTSTSAAPVRGGLADDAADRRTDPSAAMTLPETYSIGFFLQKFIRAVLIVLVAQVRWQQPDTTLPALCGRVATATSRPHAASLLAEEDEEDEREARVPVEHPLFSALRQPPAHHRTVPSSTDGMEKGPSFRLNAVEYKALAYVREYLPAFRHMVGKFVMRGANEVTRRSSQALLTRRVVEDTLAQLAKSGQEEKEDSAAPDATTRSPDKCVSEEDKDGGSSSTKAAPSAPPVVVPDPVRAAEALQKLAEAHESLSPAEVGSLYTAAAAARCYHHRLGDTLSDIVEDVEPLATNELYLSGKDAAWQPLLLDVQSVTRVLQCYAETTHPFEKMTAMDAARAAGNMPPSVESASTTTTKAAAAARGAPPSAATLPHHHLLLGALKRFVMAKETRFLAPPVGENADKTPPSSVEAQSDKVPKGMRNVGSTTTVPLPDPAPNLTRALLDTEEVKESQLFLTYLQPLLCTSAGTESEANDIEPCAAAATQSSPRRRRGLSHSQSVPVLSSQGSASRHTTADAVRSHIAHAGDVSLSPGLLDPLVWHPYAYFPDAYSQTAQTQQQQQAQEPGVGSSPDNYMMLYVAVLPISGRLVYKWEIPAEDTDRFNLSVFFQSSLFSFLQGGVIPPPTCADGAAFVHAQAQHAWRLRDAMTAATASAMLSGPSSSMFVSDAVLAAPFLALRGASTEVGACAGLSSSSSSMWLSHAASPLPLIGTAIPPALAGPMVFGGEHGSPCSVLVHCSAGMHRSCGMVLAFMLWLLFQVKKMTEFRLMRDGRRSATEKRTLTTDSSSPLAVGNTAAASASAAPPPPSRTLEACIAHVKRCRTIAEPIPTVHYLLEHFARELEVDEMV